MQQLTWFVKKGGTGKDWKWEQQNFHQIARLACVSAGPLTRRKIYGDRPDFGAFGGNDVATGET